MIREDLELGKVLVIHDFLSAEECVALIRRSEALIYEHGTVADVVIEEVRNNERVLVDDVTLASDLFHRAEPFLPADIEGQRLVGFNERWRFYRYRPGQTFKPHRDGSYLRMKSWEESQMTFMIYLNDEMTGGETRFFADMKQVVQKRSYLSVQPRKGMALAFLHSIWHEGAVVQSGQKYVLRTDVMYKPEETFGIQEERTS
ncbi:2OG-Fe(II) oxygenase [Candidatus Nitrospira bockiana]